MAGIATHLLEFPPDVQLSDKEYDKRITSFIDSLERTDPSKVVKADSQQDLLQFLDPQRNSISYLYILTLRHRAFLQTKNPSQNEAHTLLLRCLSFLQQFDHIQIRYVGRQLRELIDFTLSLAAHVGQVILYSASQPEFLGLFANNRHS